MSEYGTIPREEEPELVGYHSGLKAERCQEYFGDDHPERCTNDATHTMVLFSGKYHFMAVCDECGDPEKVDTIKNWSGETFNFAEAGSVFDHAE